MGDAAALDRVAQRFHHRVLANQLGKGLRTIFAGENAIMRLVVGLFHFFRKVEPEARRFVVHGGWFSRPSGGRHGVNQQPFRHAGGMPACGCSSVLSALRQAVRHSLSLRAASLHSAAHEVEADDPARNRCGCFLPDLTRLATMPSADFRGPYG